MTRKRFRKLMMSMGWSRNQVNSYKPFSMWPFCFMPSICSYKHAWKLDKPIFELFKNLRDQVNTGVPFAYKGYTSCIRYDKNMEFSTGNWKTLKSISNFTQIKL